MRPLRLLLPLVLLLVAVLGFAVLRGSRPEAAPAKVAERVWQVETVTVTPQAHTPTLLLYGTVEAPKRPELRAAVAGEVIQLATAEGLKVAPNQTLVVLDSRDAELTLRQRQADLAEIEAMLDSEQRRYKSDLAALEQEKAMLALDRKALTRARDLARRNLGSDSLVDEAALAVSRQELALTLREQTVADHPARLAQLQARHSRALALLDQARLELDRTRIRAPFAARVARRQVAVGDRVRVGDVLLELYADEELEIRAQIPFRYLPPLRTALERGAAPRASTVVDGRLLTARLDRLSGETAAGGGLDGLFRLTQDAEWLVPGRLLSLLLELPQVSDAVALPYSALYGLDHIYRVEQDRLTAVPVERVGEQRSPEGSALVLVQSTALQAGDRIVVTQLPSAVTGLKVSEAAQ